MVRSLAKIFKFASFTNYKKSSYEKFEESIQSRIKNHSGRCFCNLYITERRTYQMQRQMSSGFLWPDKLYVPHSNGSLRRWNLKTTFTLKKQVSRHIFDGLLYDHDAD
ncbi:hypothetical protein EGY05_01290 [Chryseobacterium arthrosphaerae]|nr:hypothetical protein EGY05_01290 [Chryseobacterium arthrosphaerae]